MKMITGHESDQKNLESQVLLRNHRDGLNLYDQLRPLQVADFDKCNRWKVCSGLDFRITIFYFFTEQ